MMVELTRKKVIVKVAHSFTQSPARAACDEAPPPTPPIKCIHVRIVCAVLSVPRLSCVDGAWERDI